MKTTRHNFQFSPAGFGTYKVTYSSPITGKSWSAHINNMPLIDSIKNSESPKKSDPNLLKKICKR